MERFLTFHTVNDNTENTLILQSDDTSETIRENIAEILQIQTFQIDFLNEEFSIVSDLDVKACNEPVTVIVHPPNRPVLDDHRTAKIDIISGDIHKLPRCEMSCGHAISPDNLYGYCYGRLSVGTSDFKCPGFTRGEPCDVIWSMEEITQKASLSEDEQTVFELKLRLNGAVDVPEIGMCPFCGYECESSGNYTCIFCDNIGRCICELCDFVFCCKCDLPFTADVEEIEYESVILLLSSLLSQDEKLQIMRN